MGRKQVEVNYIYFGVFFLLLLLTSGSGIFMKSQLSVSKTFFFLYAAGQAAFEISAFIFIGWMILRFLGPRAMMAFIGATFVFLILHLIDFVMDRILDLSVWETIGFVSDESWHNFLYLLDASGIPLWAWFCGFALLASLPFVGIALHAWTNRLACRRPLFLRREWLFQAFCCIPAALIFWEYSASRSIYPDSYTSFLKSLPWKWTFLQPKTVQYPLASSLALPLSEEKMEAAIGSDGARLKKRPNIYLFVVESLREDFITAETSPHLNRFKRESAHFDVALSNANGSHLSWFSIFHSQFSQYWNYLKSIGWKMGSPPLNLLKKWGYKVRLYSSAQLNYYGMDELLFGTNRNLIDSYQTFHHAPPLSAAHADARTIEKWKQDISDNPDLNEGQVFIFFWDATHFNYSWPEAWKPKFIPISHEISYFNLFQSPVAIEKIKNRYRNSVFCMDALFGDFLQNLPDKENAIVTVVGDHGEEFFEQGHLFHGSHLSREQTNVPLYMKFGQKRHEELPRIVSQMDIFPSILHHLSGQEISFLEGRSIFSKNHWPFVVLSRFNAGRTPYEFCIHNGGHKLIARFDSKSDIFGSSMLKIRSLWDSQDNSLFDCKGDVGTWIQTEFGPAIDRLFEKKPSLAPSE